MSFFHLLCSAKYGMCNIAPPLHNNNNKIIDTAALNTKTTTTTTTTPNTNASKRNKIKIKTKTIMARGRGLVRERNGDGSYTYAKRTANGLVYISNAEYNRLMRKRAADDGAQDSQRLKRSKSVVPETAKRDEVEVTAITLKDGKVTEDKKLKARPAKDGTLHLTDDDGASKKRPADDGAMTLKQLKDVFYKVIDALKKDLEEAKGLQGLIDKVQSESDALKLEIKKLKKTFKSNNKANKHNVQEFKKLQEENEQLKKRLNLQEEPVDATKIVNGQLVFLSEAEIDAIDRRERQRFYDVLRHNYEAQKQKEALKQKDRNNEDESAL
jgi:hypothetical protein